jgi:2-isopropylmalate synthase
MSAKKITLYDTTLRDGSQGEGVSFSVADKILFTERLDQFGVDVVEGGWPGSNPKDVEFFARMQKLKLRHAKLAAFGSTRRARGKAQDDKNLILLIEAETPIITIFGKSWLFHVNDVLRVSPEENLAMIRDSVSFLRKKNREVVYDAEHFFDGYKDDPEYALKTLHKAQEGGASTLVLCDTNGRSMPKEIYDIVTKVSKRVRLPLGIHCHNDSGTINGYGERTGNADLCAVIANLKLKMGIACVSDEKLKELTEISRFADELANMRHNTKQPYVGESAFAHKGGMHVNAVEKTPRSFEHIRPDQVGNQRRVLVSELSGKSNVALKASELGLHFTKDLELTKQIIEKIKDMEHQGYEFEAAEGSFELLVKKAMKKHRSFFKLEGFRVIVEKRENGKHMTEATVKVTVNGKTVHSAAEGDGPVHALDKALRKALLQFYPSIKDVRLADYKVRVLEGKTGTAAKVRVLIESQDKDNHVWGTVGVSENIIEASWIALVDSVEYKLLRNEDEKNN